jgi:hypothetical protein
LNQLDTPLRLVADPENFLKNRRSVPLQMFWENLQNKSFEGVPITKAPTYAGQLLDRAKHAGKLALTPIASSSFRESQELDDDVAGVLANLGLNITPGNADDLRNIESQKKFGKDYDDLELTSQKNQIDALENVQASVAEQNEFFDKQGSEWSSYRQNRDRRTADFDEEQGRYERSFQQGNLSQPLPDLMRDLKSRRYQTTQDLRTDNKALFDSLKSDPHYDSLEAYYNIEFQHEDGKIDWDRTIPARENYMEQLRKKNPDDHAWLQDFFGEKDKEKSQLERDLTKHNDTRDRLGYFAPKANTEALDRANPDIDVETWRLYGGVKDKERYPEPVLQSAAAVEKALALNLPNRPIRWDPQGGAAKRSVNENAKTKEAWKASSKLLNTYFTDAVKMYGDQEAQRLYKKPYAELDERQKQSVSGNINLGLRKSTPELDAWLAWWGFGVQNNQMTLHTGAAGQYLLQIKQRYGEAPPAPGLSYRYSEDAK